MRLSIAARRSLGIVVIVAGVLAVVLGVTTPNPFADRYTYWAEFDTVQGLGPIARDVRIAGVTIGTIGEVRRDGDDARVELVLEQDYTLHADARAEMRPHTLFEGSNFVDLSPGSPGAPVLDQGETIPIEQTSNYVTLDKALRVLRPEIRENLQELAEAGSKTLRGKAITGVQETLENAPKLNQALAPAARAAQGPERDELVGAVGGLARTVDAVAEQEDELIPLAQRLNRTAAALTVDGGAPLDASLAALPGALRELDDSAPALTGLIDRLDRLAVELTPALPDLAAALDETTPVLERSIPVLGRATPLIRDARLIASRLGKARDGLVTMFDLLPPTLDTFEQVLEVVNEPTVHGAPAYRQLNAGAFTGFDAVFRSYQTRAQNPNAPGHKLRIGVYANPSGLGGVADALGGGGMPPPSDPLRPVQASCADVAQVSGRAARQLETLGGCR